MFPAALYIEAILRFLAKERQRVGERWRFGYFRAGCVPSGRFSLDLGMPPRGKGGRLKKGLDGGKSD